MPKTEASDAYSEQETEQRLQRLLRGAFAGPPTPLKDIPKKKGGTRRLQRPYRPRKKRATVSTQAKAR
jgi:hypothetical protein